MSAAGGLGAIGAALREPSFGIYVAGNAVSLVGNWLQRTAVGWLAWELTGSATWVGAVALADLAPALLIGPFGGVLADRRERRRIMLITQTLLTATALLMWLMAALGTLGLPALLALVTVQGVLTGLNQPARLALVPSLVPPHLLPTAVAVNSIVFNGARFVGPAVAGLLIAGVGLPAAFLANALSYLAFIAALLVVRPLEAQPRRRGGAVLGELVEGVRFIARHVALGPLFLLLAGASLLVRPVGELLPALAGQVFAGGVEALAGLSSALGLGAVMGGLWLARGARDDQARLMLLALLWVAALVLALAAAPVLPAAIAAVALLGAALTAAGVSAQTIMQLAAPPLLRGRVMSLYGVMFRAGPALGALVLGGLGDLLGLRVALAAGALTFAAAWLLAWRRRVQIAAALRVPPSGRVEDVDTPRPTP
ncbi:MFS transporter [Marinimicrococcus flavescens]|uniref:MFS transporter n=1 Tax=Marinimicrococcus flavescens TaxID=3031815 RepID=A0AAP3V1Z6_9PROT|nr:MFS transporter [Marinimicrococcus flavescens]